MGSLSIWHWIVVLVVVLLLFGKGKIPALMGDLAKGINAFKSGLKSTESEVAESAKVIEEEKVSGDRPCEETDCGAFAESWRVNFEQT